MMIKFFGRTILKQFIRNEPVLFGIKLWAVCTKCGYLLNFDIYSGKNDRSNEQNSSTSTIGSRAVMGMVDEFFKISNYYVCFDNYFSSPDLLVHLLKKGLKCTETVRENRVLTKDMFPEVNNAILKRRNQKNLS